MSLHECSVGSICVCVNQESNGPSDAYAAISSADRLQAEPESLRKWREEQRDRLEALGTHTQTYRARHTHTHVQSQTQTDRHSHTHRNTQWRL